MKFSVGQRLREARMLQSLDFDTLVARTKIQEKFLKAIEADDRSSFPSGFFYKSFVDQYARALSIDTREIDEEINTILSADAPLPLPGQGDAPLPIKNMPPLVSKHRWPSSRAFTSTAALIAALVGCSGFYTWWHKIESRIAEQAQNKTQDRPAVPATPTLPKPAPKRPDPAPVPVALTAIQTPDTNPVNTSQPASGLLLELIAREETWLAVSSDGLMVFKGTLSAHESRTVEGKEFAKLRMNNPAALDVKLNGKLLGPLGRPGQFVVVVFTRDKFHVLDSAKESD